MTMGQTSEEVAARFGVTRQVQDAFAARSHDLADKAIKAGRFKEEIVPISVKVRETLYSSLRDLFVSYFARCFD